MRLRVPSHKPSTSIEGRRQYQRLRRMGVRGNVCEVRRDADPDPLRGWRRSGTADGDAHPQHHQGLIFSHLALLGQDRVEGLVEYVERVR